MLISIIVPSLLSKGPVIVARELASGLVDAGHNVIVYYLDNKCELDFPCVTHHFKWSMINDIRLADIVHSHSLRPDLLAWILKKNIRTDAIFVSTIHNYVYEDLELAYGRLTSWFISGIWKSIWAGLDGCAVLTDHARHYYLLSKTKLNLRTIYNGRSEHEMLPIDAADLSRISALKSNFRIIGSSALVTRRKGLNQIIKSLAVMKDHAFVLIGSGPELQALEDMALELGVSERFVSLGFRANARDYLPHFDIYAMPSLSEGMPLAMLEAVCAGVPIICTDIAVFREIFTEQEVSFFVLDDEPSLVGAIHRLEVAAPQFSALAKARFFENYSTNAMVKGYLSFYHDLLKPTKDGKTSLTP
jgi:glycosyltransferase involved in cell wall biosynthesis